MNKTILIVDDSNTIRSSIDYVLSNAGYDVIKAVNGQDGLDKLSEAFMSGITVSMIITDVNMPILDGISFIRELKKAELYKYIPALIVTTEFEQEKKMEGRAAGACGWLVKPFEPEQLIAVVKKFVR